MLHAGRIAAAGYRVCIVDPDPTLNFIPTYGTWVDEFVALGLEDCFEKVFSYACVELGTPDVSAERRIALN